VDIGVVALAPANGDPRGSGGEIGILNLAGVAVVAKIHFWASLYLIYIV